MAYQNYGTTEYPCLMNSPALTVDPSNPTPASRVEQAAISAAAQIKSLNLRDSVKLWAGTAAPAVADLPNAKNDDLYLQFSGENAFHLYKLTSKDNDTWSDLGSLKGAAGDDGTDGTILFSGTAVTGTVGSIEATVSGSKAGDYYINTATNNFYKASAANTWNYLCTLGTNGSDGVGVSSATVNSSGHLILTLTNGNTVDAGSVIGPAGAGSGWTASTDSSTTSITVALSNGNYNYYSNSAITALTVTSSLSNIGDTAIIEFTSPSTATTYTKPTGCRHFGDGCDSSADFTPETNTPYLLTYLKCGNGLKCFVKSL